MAATRRSRSPAGSRLKRGSRDSKRIAEEGYNLNISRYISTAIAEPEIDLTSTHAKLVEIEKEVQSATRKHNAFLEELGLAPIPSTDSDKG